MYEGGVDKGKDSDLFPGAFLYVDDQVPVSSVQVIDCGIDIRGADLVHTYGFHEKERGEEADMEQLWSNFEGYSGSGKACSGAEGTWTDRSRRVLNTPKG